MMELRQQSVLPSSLSPAGRQGLTLIEVLVTIAILGPFMTLLAFHLVGLSNIWLQGTDNDFFEQHVDGITLFIGNALLASEGQAGSSAGASLRPIEWARPPGWSEMDEPLLYFRQSEAPALLVREGNALPAIHAYLWFERGRGLSILWYSALSADAVESPNDLFNTPVSPYVVKLEYAYFDSDASRWEVTDRPLEEERGVFRLPQFIRLTFQHPDFEEQTRSILIPQTSTDVPLF